MDAPAEAYRVQGTDLDRLVLVRLYAYASPLDDTPVAWPAASRIADDLGRPLRSVRRCLARLVDHGAISRRDRPARAARDGQAWALHPALNNRTGDPPVTVTDQSPCPVGHPDPPVTGGVTHRSSRGDPPVTQILKEPKVEPQDQLSTPGFELATQEPDLADRVLGLMRDCVRRLDPKLQGPRSTSGNREMIDRATRRERATWEDWRAVIEAQFRSVRPNPQAWGYLCLSTITRPRNWARLRDAPPARAATWAPRVDAGATTETVEYFDDQQDWWDG